MVTKKIDITLSDNILQRLRTLSDESNISLGKTLEMCISLGEPLFEAYNVSGKYLPVMGKHESASEYEARVREAVQSPIDYATTASNREGSILVAYIRFLESFDGHPNRFFFRDKTLGRVIASSKTISEFKENNSEVYQKLAKDITFAEDQWVARWVATVESLAKGERSGSFDALKWIMQKDHKWESHIEESPDFEKLVKVLSHI